MSRIAEVVMSVGFESGRRAVFTAGPSGQLSPSCADGVEATAAEWARAAEVIGRPFAAPGADASARTPGGGIAWPWAD